MTKDLELLIELQKNDQEIMDIDNCLEEFPKEIEKHRGACKTAEEEFENFHKQMDEMKKSRLSLEREVEEKNAASTKAKTKINEVKTNEEYNAVLKEIENMRVAVIKLEDDQLKLMEEVESGVEKEKEIKLRVEEEKEAFNRIKKEKESEMEQIKVERKSSVSHREEIAQQIDKLYLSHYDKIFSARDGNPVAELKGGYCSGCHQTVSPQIAVEVRTQVVIHTCPHCLRFLFVPEPANKESD